MGEAATAADFNIYIQSVSFAGLFIICNKQNTEEDFREAFQKFGKIEEIYTIKDRNTGDSKGKRLALLFDRFAVTLNICNFFFLSVCVCCARNRCSLH